MKHARSIREAKAILRDLWRSGKSIGSIHTLGALHEGHATLIARSAAENAHTIVTVYPNKIQLAPESVYRYDLERDVEFAAASGATLVISSDDAEMYPAEYATFIDQGQAHANLDATVVPIIFRGMVTGALRWISLCRPTRTYWGMKDIGQALLVERAVSDLLIDTEVIFVPCVRAPNGVPISSRLVGMDSASLEEVASLYRALQVGRQCALEGESDARTVVASMRREFEAGQPDRFRLHYLKAASATTLADLETLEGPFILHGAITNGSINHFDGLLIDSELSSHPPVRPRS